MAPELLEESVEVEHVSGAEAGGDVLVPLEVLERQLTSHAAHIAAAEARWLGWLGEYCVREGWASWGCSGPVQWLSWQCGLSPSAARDKVRVALALRELPLVVRAYGEGRLSYSKVRAVTRVATPVNEANLCGLAVAATGAQLERIVRSYRTARDTQNPEVSAWSKRGWSERADGDEGVVFTLRVTREQAEHVRAAVGREVGATIDDAIGVGGTTSRDEVLEARGGYSAMAADAAVALLNGTARSDEVMPAEVEIVVNEDEHQNHGDDGGADTGCASAEAVERRLCCDPRIAVLVEDSRGTVLGSGRKTRLISRKLRRALERRDRGCCQFPGCAAQRLLHAHHVVHWAKGGPTELENLILLCTFHHHTVHEGGWNIDPATFSFIKPDGTVVERVPTSRFRGSAPETEFTAFTTSNPLAEARNEPFDLGLTLETLAQNDRIEHEPDHRTWTSPHAYGPIVPADLERFLIAERHRQTWAKRHLN